MHLFDRRTILSCAIIVLGLTYFPNRTAVAQQAVDGLVDAGPLPDVDHLLLAALPDQLLHPVRVHGRFVEQREDGERKRRAPWQGWHSQNLTSLN